MGPATGPAHVAYVFSSLSKGQRAKGKGQVWETHSQTIRSDNWRDFRKKCLFQCGGPAGIRTQISGFTDRCSTVELQNLLQCPACPAVACQLRSVAFVTYWVCWSGMGLWGLRGADRATVSFAACVVNRGKALYK